MSIVIHFIAAPFEQSFSYEGTIEDFLLKTQSVRNLINIDKSGENIFTLTPSGIAIEFGAQGTAIYDKIFNLVSKEDPRILTLNHAGFSVSTTMENGIYTYTAKINDQVAMAFQVNSKETAESAYEYMKRLSGVTDLLIQFLQSVERDFPSIPLQPPVESPKEPVDNEPAFLPVEEEKPLLPRVPVPEKNGRPLVPQKTARKQELGILICTVGGPIIEAVIVSPVAHSLKKNNLVETLKGYLDNDSMITTGDSGRHVMIVSTELAPKFESVIRSAIHDHNATDGMEIGREEYFPGKTPEGRIYL